MKVLEYNGVEALRLLETGYFDLRYAASEPVDACILRKISYSINDIAYSESEDKIYVIYSRVLATIAKAREKPPSSCLSRVEELADVRVGLALYDSFEDALLVAKNICRLCGPELLWVRLRLRNKAFEEIYALLRDMDPDDSLGVLAAICMALNQKCIKSHIAASVPNLIQSTIDLVLELPSLAERLGIDLVSYVDLAKRVYKEVGARVDRRKRVVLTAMKLLGILTGVDYERNLKVLLARLYAAHNTRGEGVVGDKGGGSVRF